MPEFCDVVDGWFEHLAGKGQHLFSSGREVYRDLLETMTEAGTQAGVAKSELAGYGDADIAAMIKALGG